MDVKLVINHAPEEESIENGEVVLNKKSTYDEIPLSVALSLIKEAGQEAFEALQITVRVK